MLLKFQERLIMAEKWWSFTQKGDCVHNTFFKHRSLHKYTRVAKGKDRVEIKIVVDLLWVKRGML